MRLYIKSLWWPVETNFLNGLRVEISLVLSIAVPVTILFLPSFTI